MSLFPQARRRKKKENETQVCHHVAVWSEQQDQRIFDIRAISREVYEQALLASRRREPRCPWEGEAWGYAGRPRGGGEEGRLFSTKAQLGKLYHERYSRRGFGHGRYILLTVQVFGCIYTCENVGTVETEMIDRLWWVRRGHSTESGTCLVGHSRLFNMYFRTIYQEIKLFGIT